MNLQPKHRRIIAIALAIIIISMGLLGYLNILKIDENILNKVTSVMLIVAVLIVFTGRKKSSGEITSKDAANEDVASKDTLSEVTRDAKKPDKNVHDGEGGNQDM